MSDDESDGLLSMLQECGESLFDVPAADAESCGSSAGEVGEQGDPGCPPPSLLVGPTPEELDSLKEMIHFDHVYSKRTDVDEADVSTHAVIVDDGIDVQDSVSEASVEIYPVADEEMLREPFATSSFATAPSPASSVETGYDSADSPEDETTFLDSNPWEDPLVELFPSLA